MFRRAFRSRPARAALAHAGLSAPRLSLSRRWRDAVSSCAIGRNGAARIAFDASRRASAHARTPVARAREFILR